jgi:hypothetical protein
MVHAGVAMQSRPNAGKTFICNLYPACRGRTLYLFVVAVVFVGAEFISALLLWLLL